MSIAELRKLSSAEKLKIIEALWEDLSCKPEDIESPEWHRDVLREREKRIASGEAKFSDWEKAKDEIRRRTS